MNFLDHGGASGDDPRRRFGSGITACIRVVSVGTRRSGPIPAAAKTVEKARADASEEASQGSHGAGIALGHAASVCAGKEAMP